MKKCPFCAEEIQDDAVKCRYCGEFLNQKNKPRWYFGTTFLVIAFLCVGPLVLPLVWFNPNYSSVKKLVITLIMILISYGLWVGTQDARKYIKEYYGIINQHIPH